MCNSLSDDSVYASLSLEDLLADPVKLQKRLTTAVGESKALSLLAVSDNVYCSARLRSIARKEAGAWLHAVPTGNDLAMNTREFRVSACLRLGLPLFDQWATTCDCGSPVDDSGYHLLTCKLHGGPVREHDSIVSVWSTCLRSVGVYHKQQVRNRYVDSFGRPDIVTFDSGNLSNSEIDDSLAHPYNKELIFTSAKVNGHAASVKEKKVEKYARFRNPGGFTPEVIPLVLEHFGKWGSGAIDFLKSL